MARKGDSRRWRRVPLDLLDDVGLSLWRRRFRTSLVGLGVASGVGLLVLAVSASTTAASEVARRFDALVATEVRVVPRRAGNAISFDRGVDARLENLPGVKSAGRLWQLGSLPLGIGPRDIQAIAATSVPVAAVSPGAWEYLDATIEGHEFTAADDAVGTQVAFVGAGLASTFEQTLAAGINIAIAGEQFEIAGILNDVGRYPDALFTVLIPSATASRLWPSLHFSPEIVIEVDPGSATVVAQEAPLVIDPFRAEGLLALYTPEPDALRRDVSAQVELLPALLSAFLVIGGAVAIGTAWYANVLERRNEIGLRRALGATGTRIAILILTETTLVGLLASLVGLVASITTFLLLAGVRGWVPVVPNSLALIAVLLGTAISLTAGIVPAVRAARLEPADALRSGAL